MAVSSIRKGSWGHRYASSIMVCIIIIIPAGRIYIDDYVQSEWSASVRRGGLEAAPHIALQRVVVTITNIKRLDQRSQCRCRLTENRVFTVDYIDRTSQWVLASPLIITYIAVASSYPGCLLWPSLYMYKAIGVRRESSMALSPVTT